MRFGSIPLDEAEGAILAHSLRVGETRWKKGRCLSASDLAQLREAGRTEIVGAILAADDVPEDQAAARIAAALNPGSGIAISAPFTGRVNFFSEGAGVIEVDADLVHRINKVDEGITIATLEPLQQVHARQMLATVKIIPYGVPEHAVRAVEALLVDAASSDRQLIRLRPFQVETASLILTRTAGMADKVIDKGARVIRDRIAALDMQVADQQVVGHETGEISRALRTAKGQIILILTGSATSDRFDVGPAGLVETGGHLIRFGMPVDPGNLLFLGQLAERPVVGLPGCARSPKLNGADWVLERLAAKVPVDSLEISKMGVGGLLKEIPSRPNPRASGEALSRRPVIAAILLAAGQSRRMRGRDKLLEPVAGEPLLRRIARAAIDSSADRAVAVLRPDDPRSGVLEGLELDLAVNPRAAEGMGTSLACGIRALSPDVEGAIILMSDMPEIGPEDLNRLIAGFDPAEGREIVRATSADGRPGHPVLFGRRFFEPLAALSGDQGAREVLREHSEFVTDVALPGEAALTDLDTEKAWADWRARAS
ncbi:MAG: molybdopterin-binding/glycosyltransferase family 2 protein [Pseudomonadota bacterium]